MTPTLATARLILRPYTGSERAAFVAMFTDPVKMAHLDGAMSPEVADTLLSELAGLAPLRPRVHTAWAVHLDGAYVAHAVLLNEEAGVEVGYMVVATHHGRGIATEIAAALLEHGHRTLGLAELIATVDEDNLASRRVLEKVGMVPLRREADGDGAWWVYSHRI